MGARTQRIGVGTECPPGAVAASGSIDFDDSFYNKRLGNLEANIIDWVIVITARFRFVYKDLVDNGVRKVSRELQASSYKVQDGNSKIVLLKATTYYYKQTSQRALLRRRWKQAEQI